MGAVAAVEATHELSGNKKAPKRNSPEGLVERTGIEPATPCLQSRCSPS